jgi:putative DNA primase/helicase
MTTKNKQLAALQAVTKWCLKSEAAPRINAMVDLARSEPGIAIKPQDLDIGPWLFNCPDGTLELKTATLRDHKPEDLITKICPTRYDPNATCTTWENFLDTIFQRDQDLITFNQRFFGYCLTGDVREQIILIFWG